MPEEFTGDGQVEPGDDAVTVNVHALIQDLLPVLVPDGVFDGVGAVVLSLGAGEQVRDATRPLVQQCRAEPNPMWPRMVDAWLREVQRQGAAAVPVDLAAQTRDLRVRMVARMSDGLSAGVLRRAMTDHIDLVAVIDQPDRTQRVTLAMVEASGVPEAGILQTAIANTMNELVDVDIRDHDLTGADSIRLIAKDGSPYVAGVLLVIRQFVSEPAPYGVLVAAPQASMLTLHQVSSDRVLDLIPPYSRLTAAMFAEGSDPVSPEIYWWLDGTFHPISVGLAADGVSPRLNLPPALAPVVGSLPRV